MDDSLKLPRGFVAMLAEEDRCFCGDGTEHRHAYHAIYDGEHWVRLYSEEGQSVSRSAMLAKDN